MLRAQANWLVAQYAVEAFGLIDTAHADDDVRLLVRFKPAPDLHTFFELEQRLSECLSCRVDLLPAESAPADLLRTRVRWLHLDL